MGCGDWNWFETGDSAAENNKASDIVDIAKKHNLNLDNDMKDFVSEHFEIKPEDIDKEKGVGIDDCERYSRTIDPLLDEIDPIEEQYTLQISSPGLERVIKNDFHLQHCIGETVSIKLYAPIDGFKEFVGELISFTAETVTVDADGIYEIPRKAIGKMNTYFEI